MLKNLGVSCVSCSNMEKNLPKDIEKDHPIVEASYIHHQLCKKPVAKYASLTNQETMKKCVLWLEILMNKFLTPYEYATCCKKAECWAPITHESIGTWKRKEGREYIMVCIILLGPHFGWLNTSESCKNMNKNRVTRSKSKPEPIRNKANGITWTKANQN